MSMARTWPTGVFVAGIVVAVGFTARGPLAAQGGSRASRGRVACVDVVKVFNEYQREKDLEEEMKQERDKLELEAARRKQRIDAAKAVLDAMSLDDPTYAKKMRELLELNISTRNWMDITQAAMAREVGVWTTTVYKEILAVVETIAKEREYDLVFYRDEFQVVSMDPAEVREQIRARKLIYASAAADISQAVLDKLNADYRAKPRKKMISIP